VLKQSGTGFSVMKFVYCAYGGEKYAAQLIQSVESARRWHPAAQIVVYTVPEFQPYLSDLKIETRLLPGQPARQLNWHDPFMKVSAVCDAAEIGNAFIYLDADTFMAADLAEAWELLQHYDCLGVPSAIPDQRGFLGLPPVPELKRPSPQVFAEWNGGVLLFAGTDGARRVARRWLEVLEMRIPGGGDQWPLAQALWDSGACIHALPATYNCRLPAMPVVYGRVRVLHADHPDLAAVAEHVNEGLGLRQIVPSDKGYIATPIGQVDRRLF
jgi:hypothetical protein